MRTVAASLCCLLASLSVASAQLVPPDFILPIPPPRIDLSDTRSDPMQVREMAIVASVRGLHATVDTTITFRNPNPRLLEGDLSFPLPDGAAVCGYALDLDGALVEGVVVKKEKARVAFESETRRRVDPGLVEHVKGNLYRTRIYPLPAHGARTIRLSYTAPLPASPAGDAALLLPMPRETIERLSIQIEVANANMPAPELGGLGDRRFVEAGNFWRVESTTTNATPSSDVWVAMPKLPPLLSSVEQSPDGAVWFSISALAPTLSREPGRKPPAKIHLLWDASGSRALADLHKEYDLISALEADAFDLVVFRDAPEAAREFKSAADLVAALKETPFDGGSDFAALAAALPADGAPLLLFTDGLDTLSGAPLAFSGATPVAIVSQTVADREALRQACAGSLLDLQTLDVAAALAQIADPGPRVAGLQGTGIAHLQGIGRPALGRVTLLGQLTAPEATVQIEYSGGTLSAPFSLRAADARPGKTLATAWAAARVNQLSPRAEQFEDDLLALGRAYGLVSPATSLIVLESLDQWVRHGIEPPASLPDLRESYFAALKNRGQEEADARTRHLKQLADLWGQRVDWWKTDFSKNPLPPAPSPAGRDAEGSFPVAMRMASPAAAPPGIAGFSDMGSPLEGEAAPAEAFEDADAFGGAPPEMKSAATPARPAASIQIKEWNPDTPYLKAIRKADPARRYEAYLAERKEWAQSPAFFLDCAEEFLHPRDRTLGLRILSNLAELRIEDPALLRVFAWRLRQAGDLDRALVLLRRVAKLRAEEPQSFRDLALALAERGKASRRKADLEESMALLLRVALTPWNRHSDSIPLFALEELNALVAWVQRQDWPDGEKPDVPDYDVKLRDNLDTDIRISMSWDADATDIDLHVVEPGGEEAFFGHNRTARGGLVSRDITDGYGPEEYLIRAAPHGAYAIQAKYYGSRQQTLVGAATVAATVFTDWGRPAEKRQTLTLRLDKPRDKVDIGSVSFGTADASGAPRAPADFTALRPGMSRQEVENTVGEPTRPDPDGPWRYEAGPRAWLVHFNASGMLVRVVEILPGGMENLVVQ